MHFDAGDLIGRDLSTARPEPPRVWASWPRPEYHQAYQPPPRVPAGTDG